MGSQQFEIGRSRMDKNYVQDYSDYDSERDQVSEEALAGKGDTIFRRYQQLTKMMVFHNAEFDERKYWTYGCNCLILGDRPMSDPGLGKPVDALDSVCKKYKECVKCARLTHGEKC